MQLIFLILSDCIFDNLLYYYYYIILLLLLYYYFDGKFPIIIEKEMTETSLHVGKLINIDWKVGVALQSSHCKNLNSPFVRVTLLLEDENSVRTTNTFEMTLLEFKVFSRKFTDINTAMEQLI